MEYSAEIQAIGDRIYGLTPEGASMLLNYLKEVYNIEAPVVFQPEKKQEQEVEKPKVQTEFTVILEGYDPANKIPLVKAYRELTSAGLKDAMAAITNCPVTVKENVAKEEADRLKSVLEECGGKVTLK